MSDKLTRIDPEQFEREQRLLFEYSDISDTSKHSGIRYGTLTKQLNPGDPTPSIATEFLAFLFGCRATRPELEEAVWALVSRYRRQMFAEGSDGKTCLSTFDATYHELKAVIARREASQATDADVEAARERHIESTARVGAGCRLVGAAMKEQPI